MLPTVSTCDQTTRCRVAKNGDSAENTDSSPKEKDKKKSQIVAFKVEEELADQHVQDRIPKELQPLIVAAKNALHRAIGPRHVAHGVAHADGVGAHLENLMNADHEDDHQGNRDHQLDDRESGPGARIEDRG